MPEKMQKCKELVQVQKKHLSLPVEPRLRFVSYSHSACVDKWDYNKVGGALWCGFLRVEKWKAWELSFCPCSWRFWWVASSSSTLPACSCFELTLFCHRLGEESATMLHCPWQRTSATRSQLSTKATVHYTTPPTPPFLGKSQMRLDFIRFSS